MRFLKKLFDFLVQPRQLYLYIVFAIVVPNVMLCFTEKMSLCAGLTNVFLPMFVYACLFTLGRRPGLMIWILFPFIFLSAFQLVLLYLFGNSIIAVDMFLNLVTTNASEAMELLDNLVPAVLGVFVLYIPVLILAAISIRRKDRLSAEETRKFRRIAFWGALGSGALLGGSYASAEDYDARVDLFPLNVCYNCYLAIERTEDVENYAETSRNFKFQAVSSHDAELPEIYLMVIGETGRACSWGLYGYGRNTTPKLQRQSGLVCFTDVLTQSNTTHKSVPLLLSLASAEDYDRIYREKSIITAFKEAGFYTAFFSNQKYNHAFIDIFGREADTSFFLKEEGEKNKNNNDNELLDKVDEVLREGHQKLFVVLHTYGSHFNYKERYPEHFGTFKPDKASEASPKNRSVLVNAYDNTILQTDAFLNRIIERLARKKALSGMIYTSDHGEDIFDDERHLFLHSSPVPSYYQLHVPFIIWTSEEYREHFADAVRLLQENRSKPVSSNLSVIHTFMDMAGLRTPFLVDSLSLMNERYHVGCRYYVNDHNLPGTYDDIGLDDEDFELFKKHGIEIR